jgi:hypothetical protein
MSKILGVSKAALPAPADAQRAGHQLVGLANWSDLGMSKIALQAPLSTKALSANTAYAVTRPVQVRDRRLASGPDGATRAA